ncbi:histidinol-phosphate transaminase [Cytobacillus sp. Hm23]
MDIKKQFLTLKPYQPGKPTEEVQKEYGLDKIVKLASNENPFGSSNKVKSAINDSLTSLAIYPDGYAANLREKLANHLSVAESQLIFGNGSDEVIQVISRAFLGPGTNTVMATPTFPQYRHNAIIEGAEIKEVPLIEGHHNLDEMLNAIDDNTQIVWLCSPNNPTGTYINSEKLLTFLNNVPNDVLVVVDEAYYEYVTATDYPETVSLLDSFNNLMILRTFSKAHGLAALRIGYGISHQELLQKIEPGREPFNTNRLSQAAALASLDDQDFIDQCVQKNKEGLQQFYTFCEQYQLSYYPSEGNFILIDFETEGNEIFQYLLERGFIVRSGNALGFPTSVRITVGSKEQNEEIINILSEMLSNKTANMK